MSPLEQNTTIGERMLRRSIVVPSERLDHSGRELVADEQLVDDGLDFLAVQVDVPAPPPLEAEIARGLGVDLGVQVVLFGPQGVCGILVLEILHQPGAVEFAAAEIAGERGEPAAAEQAAASSASGTCRARRPNRTAATPR